MDWTYIAIISIYILLASSNRTRLIALTAICTSRTEIWMSSISYMPFLVIVWTLITDVSRCKFIHVDDNGYYMYKSWSMIYLEFSRYLTTHNRNVNLRTGEKCDNSIFILMLYTGLYMYVKTRWMFQFMCVRHMLT